MSQLLVGDPTSSSDIQSYFRKSGVLEIKPHLQDTSLFAGKYRGSLRVSSWIVLYKTLYPAYNTH